MNQTDAMLNELAYQRMLLGDRCANLAGQVAVLTAERDAARAELVKLKEEKKE